MERVKNLAKRLFCIPWGLALILAVLAAAALVWVFALGNEDSPLAYGCYVLAFYALVTVCVSLAPAVVRWGRSRRQARDQMAAGELEKSFQTSLWQGLAIKVAYAGGHLVVGVLEQSKWMLSIGGYYLVLAAIRLLLAWDAKKVQAAADEAEKARRGWACFRNCGVLLLVLHVAAAAIIAQVTREGQTKGGGEIMVIANAAYTFYRVIVAVVGVVQHRRNPGPVWGASKNMKLTEAWMSLYFLQTAMLTTFNGDPAFRDLMNSLTGAAVCMMAVFGAAGMMVHGQRRKNSLER